jgi:hypothetical protein
MINLHSVMSKNLSDIDKVYGRLNQYATVKERVKYCTSLIQRTENFVTKNRETLTEHVKKRSFDIIIAAETEINKLSQSN